MEIFTKSGLTLVKDIVNLDKGTNEMGSYEQDNEKSKWLEKSNENIHNINKTCVEKLRVMEEKVESKEAPQEIDCNIPHLEESSVVSRLDIKMPPSFLQRHNKKEDYPTLKKFLAKFPTYR